jgi:hypothetical protein
MFSPDEGFEWVYLTDFATVLLIDREEPDSSADADLAVRCRFRLQPAFDGRRKMHPGGA